MRLLLAAVALGLFTTSLVACSADDTEPTKKETKKKSSSKNDGDDDKDEKEPTKTPEPEPEPEPSPVVTSGLVTIDIGAIAPNTPVTFDIPANAVGFNVVVVNEGALSAAVGIQSLKSPDGVFAAQSNVPKGGTFPTSEDIRNAALSVPQGQVEPTPGTWTLVANGPAGKLHAYAKVQVSADGVFHGGALDIVIHVPNGVRFDAETLTVAKAETSKALKGRIDGFFAGVKSLYGLDRGTVQFREIAAKFITIQTDQALAEASMTAKGDPKEQALHFVLTNDLMDGRALGTTSGIPGAATLSGTTRSIVAIRDAEQGAEQDALTMLHEGGHFFGLNHTSEFENYGHDPLGDTPECTNTSLSTPEVLYDCPDSSYLMFAAGPLTGSPVVSNWQRRVVQGSPIYRAYKQDSGAAAKNLAAPIALPKAKIPMRCGLSAPLRR